MSGAGFLEGLSERAPWGIVCRKTFDLEYKHLWKGLFHSLNVRESEVNALIVALANGVAHSSFLGGRDPFVWCTTHLIILEMKVLFLAKTIDCSPTLYQRSAIYDDIKCIWSGTGDTIPCLSVRCVNICVAINIKEPP